MSLPLELIEDICTRVRVCTPRVVFFKANELICNAS